jgi:hypothetical protein
MPSPISPRSGRCKRTAPTAFPMDTTRSVGIRMGRSSPPNGVSPCLPFWRTGIPAATVDPSATSTASTIDPDAASRKPGTSGGDRRTGSRSARLSRRRGHGGLCRRSCPRPACGGGSWATALPFASSRIPFRGRGGPSPKSSPSKKRTGWWICLPWSVMRGRDSMTSRLRSGRFVLFPKRERRNRPAETEKETRGSGRGEPSTPRRALVMITSPDRFPSPRPIRTPTRGTGGTCSKTSRSLGGATCAARRKRRKLLRSARPAPRTGTRGGAARATRDRRMPRQANVPPVERQGKEARMVRRTIDPLRSLNRLRCRRRP